MNCVKQFTLIGLSFLCLFFFSFSSGFLFFCRLSLFTRFCFMPSFTFNHFILWTYVSCRLSLFNAMSSRVLFPFVFHFLNIIYYRLLFHAVFHFVSLHYIDFCFMLSFTYYCFIVLAFMSCRSSLYY